MKKTPRGTPLRTEQTEEKAWSTRPYTLRALSGKISDPLTTENARKTIAIKLIRKLRKDNGIECS